MPDLPLHDHGWLALPLELRQRLGLRTGDRLQIEMIDGGVRLRPAGQAAKAAPPAPAPMVEDPLPAKRGRGRPRKQVSVDQAVEPTATAATSGKRAMRGLFSTLKIGGRRTSTPAGTA